MAGGHETYPIKMGQNNKSSAANVYTVSPAHWGLGTRVLRPWLRESSILPEELVCGMSYRHFSAQSKTAV